MKFQGHMLTSAMVVSTLLATTADVSAQAYGSAYVNIYDLAVTSTDENGANGPFFLPLSAFTEFNVFATTIAFLDVQVDPANPPSSDFQRGPADAQPAFGLNSVFPLGAPGNNAMTLQGQAGNYAYSDSQVGSTSIAQPLSGGPVVATGTLTQSWLLGEGYVAADGSANVGSDNASQTGLDTTIVLAQPAIIAFDFLADPFLQVALSAAASSGTINANIDVTLSISGDAGTIFSWTPDGQPGGIVGGTELTDEGDLNQALSITSPGLSALYDPTGDSSVGDISPATGLAYSARTDVIPPGTYTLSLDMSQNVDIITVQGAPLVDLGDNPDTGAGTGSGNYETTVADGGAAHEIKGPYLGFCVDADAAAQPSAGANGDDNTSGTALGTCVNGDDEDGIQLPSNVIPGGDYTLTVNMPNNASAEDCFVDGWIDFNDDGDFLDAGEQIVAQSFAASSGETSVPFSVPASAAMVNDYYSRFRCTRAGGALPTGSIDHGEVEDYRIPAGNVAVPVMGIPGLGLLFALLSGAVFIFRRRR